MISRQRAAEIARYLVTGALGASLQVLLTLLLTEVFGLHYLLSLTVGAAMVIAIGFVLNRAWTFRKAGGTVLAEFGRYLLVTAGNVVIGVLGCALMVQQLRVPYVYAIVIVAVTFAPLTYLVHRAWTFGLAWLRES